MSDGYPFVEPFCASLHVDPSKVGIKLVWIGFCDRVVLIGEVIGGFLFGWHAVITNWKKASEYVCRVPHPYAHLGRVTSTLPKA